MARKFATSVTVCLSRILQVTHRSEMTPTGPEQCRHLPPPGDSFGGVTPVLQGIPVAWLTAALFSAAVYPAGNGSSRLPLAAGMASLAGSGHGIVGSGA